MFPTTSEPLPGLIRGVLFGSPLVYLAVCGLWSSVFLWRVSEGIYPGPYLPWIYWPVKTLQWMEGVTDRVAMLLGG